jgi:cytochrome c-type biogenesis protein CcmH/NrfG
MYGRKPTVSASRSRGRALLVALGTVGVAVIGVIAATNWARSAGPDDTPHPPVPTRDLSQVSNEEMEAVIAANPDVVPMRLELVERYLDAGDVTRAHAHAEEAATRATEDDDRARSLRYVGWTVALLGDPVEGERVLRQSLSIEADHPDSLWFLARVLFEGQARPADAIPMLEEILAAGDLPDTERPSVQRKLEEARAALAGAPNPTLPTLP